MTLSLLHLKGVPIFEQLQIEEALLRSGVGNWCLINTEAPEAIVMGISGKMEKLLNLPLLSKHPIPLIKRFSGGGTVYIDSQTLFVTFIFNTDAFAFEPFPTKIMEWSEKLYAPLFPPHFHLRENDYVIGNHKVGGNAQYIQKNRWLHHTSFLWDFDSEKMEYLTLPEKRPSYRTSRPHKDFLTRLKDHFPCQTNWINSLVTHLQGHFQVNLAHLHDIESILKAPHRKSTHFLTISNL